MTDRYSPADRVFAKVKGHHTWPARVKERLPGRSETYRIYFYGTYEMANVRVDKIFPYNKHNVAKFEKGQKKPRFKEALQEIADDLLIHDPKSTEVIPQKYATAAQEQVRHKAGSGTKTRPASSSGKAKTPTDEEEEYYEVEKILSVRFSTADKREFLVQWKGWSAQDVTWEPEENLECVDLLKEFATKVSASNNVHVGQNPGPSRPFQPPSSPMGENPAKGRRKGGGRDEDLEAAKILSVRFSKADKREFLVQWKGRGSNNVTWVAEENLECVDLLKEFVAKVSEYECKTGFGSGFTETKRRGRPSTSPVTPSDRSELTARPAPTQSNMSRMTVTTGCTPLCVSDSRPDPIFDSSLPPPLRDGDDIVRPRATLPPPPVILTNCPSPLTPSNQILAQSPPKERFGPKRSVEESEGQSPYRKKSSRDCPDLNSWCERVRKKSGLIQYKKAVKKPVNEKRRPSFNNDVDVGQKPGPSPAFQPHSPRVMEIPANERKEERGEDGLEVGNKVPPNPMSTSRYSGIHSKDEESEPKVSEILSTVSPSLISSHSTGNESGVWSTTLELKTALEAIRRTLSPDAAAALLKNLDAMVNMLTMISNGKGQETKSNAQSRPSLGLSIPNTSIPTVKGKEIKPIQEVTTSRDKSPSTGTSSTVSTEVMGESSSKKGRKRNKGNKAVSDKRRMDYEGDCTADDTRSLTSNKTSKKKRETKYKSKPIADSQKGPTGRRIIGPRDIVVNVGLGKIKMESDYVPPSRVKLEPQSRSDGDDENLSEQEEDEKSDCESDGEMKVEEVDLSDCDLEIEEEVGEGIAFYGS